MIMSLLTLDYDILRHYVQIGSVYLNQGLL